ncbi:double-CXXCG motif protein [Myxococcus sp. Y35]|uniref:SitI6 family double-CXXCG motif immunity protein n=1 Tax=Pseudomyxococcus flavus TaxID=3115648 RepID=UPI003CEB989F
MTRFFWLGEDTTVAANQAGSIDAWHKWGLPGVHCPTCGATWSDVGHEYPCVDLSHLPERALFEQPRPEPFSEFSRLREQVRPLAPPHAALPPGTGFGPLTGKVTGRLGSIAWVDQLLLLVQPHVMKRLQDEGVEGLVACRTELRFRQKNPPEFLELQLEPLGQLHADCIPPETPPPCRMCGRHGFTRPETPILDAASLPSGVDLFRVGNFATMVVGTERFMEAVRRQQLEGITFRELPTR